MSRQKYTTAPTNVPMCRATSNVLFSCSFVRMLQWNSHGTRMRWPELETGANSVSPWTMPRMIAWNELVDAPLAGRRERAFEWSRSPARRRACYRPDLSLSPIRTEPPHIGSGSAGSDPHGHLVDEDAAQVLADHEDPHRLGLDDDPRPGGPGGPAAPPSHRQRHNEQGEGCELEQHVLGGLPPLLRPRDHLEPVHQPGCHGEGAAHECPDDEEGSGEHEAGVGVQPRQEVEGQDGDVVGHREVDEHGMAGMAEGVALDDLPERPGALLAAGAAKAEPDHRSGASASLARPRPHTSSLSLAPSGPSGRSS